MSAEFPEFFERFIDEGDYEAMVLVRRDGAVELRGNTCPIDFARKLAITAAHLLKRAHSHDDEVEDGVAHGHPIDEPTEWTDRHGRVWEPIGMRDATGAELLRTAGITESYPYDAVAALYGPLIPAGGDGS